jgi:hypothetical protein
LRRKGKSEEGPDAQGCARRWPVDDTTGGGVQRGAWARDTRGVRGLQGELGVRAASAMRSLNCRPTWRGSRRPGPRGRPRRAWGLVLWSAVPAQRRTFLFHLTMFDHEDVQKFK